MSSAARFDEIALVKERDGAMTDLVLSSRGYRQVLSGIKAELLWDKNSTFALYDLHLIYLVKRN